MAEAAGGGLRRRLGRFVLRLPRRLLRHARRFQGRPGHRRRVCDGVFSWPRLGGARLALLARARCQAAMSMLRLWLIATALALAAVMIWAFTPVLVFLALLTGGLGLIAFSMIALARALERRLRK